MGCCKKGHMTLYLAKDLLVQLEPDGLTPPQIAPESH